MSNVYSPVRNAFAQSDYHDQQATALAGSRAFASDSDLVDAFIVGEKNENGLEAGMAVVCAPASGMAVRDGVSPRTVMLPESTATVDDICGIVLRNQQMPSNAAGKACFFQGDVCNVVRTGRSGGRVWARLAPEAAPADGDAVYVMTGGENAGTLTCVAPSGGEADRVAVPSMHFRSVGRGGIALVELV